MDINKCPNCQKQFDQDKRVSKQLPCGCITCLKCYKIVFQLTQEIRCKIHQKAFSIKPEELQTFMIQKKTPKDLPQFYVKVIDQVQINKQFRWLQGQYAQKQNYYLKLREAIQNSAQFMKHIQSLVIKEILKSLLDQFSMSNVKIENLLKRLSEFQVVNETYQQQALTLSQQDLQLGQQHQDQLQQQFQSILSEIEELKKDQWMDIQSLRVNVQRCMFEMFVYLSENSKGQLLTDKEAECLVQNYFKQFKVQNSFSQVSNSVVQQEGQFLSKSIDQQLIQKIQYIDQQLQNQVIDKQQGQDIVQDEQVLVQKEISLQEQQVIDARSIFQQLEQKLMSIQNDFSFINQANQLCYEQAINIKPISPVVITFDDLVQFLNQIKEENVSLQALQFSLLNNSGLIESPQILNQLASVTDQQIQLKLSEIIQLSKNQPKIQQAAANALTILNFMNFDFTNQDFQNLDLSMSDLSDTTFTSCNFENSNLTQANLRNSKFINCDLSNSNLTSIITEHPLIFAGHTGPINSISISSDSKLIVSGSLDKTVRLWDVKIGHSKTMSGHIN